MKTKVTTEINNDELEKLYSDSKIILEMKNYLENIQDSEKNMNIENYNRYVSQYVQDYLFYFELTDLIYRKSGLEDEDEDEVKNENEIKEIKTEIINEIKRIIKVYTEDLEENFNIKYVAE